MRITALIRSTFFALAMASCAAALPACKSSPEITAENIADRGAVTEQHESASVTMTVLPDGRVRALVKSRDGKPMTEGVTGSLTATVPGADVAPVNEKLVPVPGSGGVLAARIPKLEDDLTEVGYELRAGNATLKGVLHVPRGGTPELLGSARANTHPEHKGKKGPNGGVLQVVGDDTLEIVADQATGELRVYVLSSALQPVPIEDREVKLAITTTADSEVVVLAPGPQRLYFVGRLRVKVNPIKITVVVTRGDRVHVILCGYHPDTVLVVGPAAPAIGILIATTWLVDVSINPTPAVIVKERKPDVIVVRKGKGKGKGKWRFR